ncbi:hypothetical protein ACWKWK_09250 [Pseudoxanthomonas beigongshangi]
MSPRAGLPRACRWLMSAWLSSLCMIAPAFAEEDAADCQPREQVVVQADGSRLRLAVRCADTGGEEDRSPSRFEVAYAASGSERFQRRLVLQADAMEEPLRDVGFVDIDGDGFSEIEARGMCGAGPNCLGDLYRLDPATGELHHFFSGGYADLRVIDGHLVESGRASCCAWESHAWPLDGPPRLRDYDNMALMITIGADMASDRDDAPARCTFSRRNGDNWQVVAPPGAAWLALCEVYGDDYHLVTPEEARAADAASAQEP